MQTSFDLILVEIKDVSLMEYNMKFLSNNYQIYLLRNRYIILNIRQIKSKYECLTLMCIVMFNINKVILNVELKYYSKMNYRYDYQSNPSVSNSNLIPCIPDKFVILHKPGPRDYSHTLWVFRVTCWFSSSCLYALYCVCYTRKLPAFSFWHMYPWTTR